MIESQEMWGLRASVATTTATTITTAVAATVTTAVATVTTSTAITTTVAAPATVAAVTGLGCGRLCGRRRAGIVRRAM